MVKFLCSLIVLSMVGLEALAPRTEVFKSGKRLSSTIIPAVTPMWAKDLGEAVGPRISRALTGRTAKGSYERASLALDVYEQSLRVPPIEYFLIFGLTLKEATQMQQLQRLRVSEYKAIRDKYQHKIDKIGVYIQDQERGATSEDSRMYIKGMLEGAYKDIDRERADLRRSLQEQSQKWVRDDFEKMMLERIRAFSVILGIDSEALLTKEGALIDEKGELNSLALRGELQKYRAFILQKWPSYREKIMRQTQSAMPKIVPYLDFYIDYVLNTVYRYDQLWEQSERLGILDNGLLRTLRSEMVQLIFPLMYFFHMMNDISSEDLTMYRAVYDQGRFVHSEDGKCQQKGYQNLSLLLGGMSVEGFVQKTQGDARLLQKRREMINGVINAFWPNAAMDFNEEARTGNYSVHTRYALAVMLISINWDLHIKRLVAHNLVRVEKKFAEDLQKEREQRRKKQEEEVLFTKRRQEEERRMRVQVVELREKLHKDLRQRDKSLEKTYNEWQKVLSKQRKEVKDKKKDVLWKQAEGLRSTYEEKTRTSLAQLRNKLPREVQVEWGQLEVLIRERRSELSMYGSTVGGATRYTLLEVDEEDRVEPFDSDIIKAWLWVNIQSSVEDVISLLNSQDIPVTLNSLVVSEDQFVNVHITLGEGEVILKFQVDQVIKSGLWLRAKNETLVEEDRRSEFKVTLSPYIHDKDRRDALKVELYQIFYLFVTGDKPENLTSLLNLEISSLSVMAEGRAKKDIVKRNFDMINKTHLLKKRTSATLLNQTAGARVSA